MSNNSAILDSNDCVLIDAQFFPAPFNTPKSLQQWEPMSCTIHDSPFDSPWNSEKSILNSQKDARLWAAIMEILLMFYCFLSNDKSNAFRIGIQLFTPYSQKKNIQCFFIFMPFFFENFDFSNPRIFELFNLSIGSLKNQDIVTCNRIRIL